MFRDYLNEHIGDAKNYEKLKFRLMDQYQGNRILYTEGKMPFCKEIIEKARREKK